MAIVKMEKFTLFVDDGCKQALLGKLQRFENVHFKNLQELPEEEFDFLEADSAAEQVSRLEEQRQKIQFVLDKVSPYAKKPKGLQAYRAGLPEISYEQLVSYASSFDFDQIHKAVAQTDAQIAAIAARRAQLLTEIEEILPWLDLDVSVARLEQLRMVGHLFGTVNRASFAGFTSVVESEFPEVYIEAVGVQKDDCTLLVMFPREAFEEVYQRLKELGFSRVSPKLRDLPQNIITQNEQAVSELDEEARNAGADIAAYAEYYEKLGILQDSCETALEKAHACKNFMRTRSVVMAEGWIPSSEKETLAQMLGDICGPAYYLKYEQVDKDDEEVPIKLKNNALVSPFESITETYSMPRYNEIDPTPVYMPFYWLFFGLMAGDIGYGALMLIGTAIVLAAFKLKEGTRQFIKFFFYLSFAVILGGLVYGGCFGMTVFTPIPTGDGGYKAILDAQTDVTAMLLVSVALGVVHVLIGVWMKGVVHIKNGRPLDALFDAGIWTVTILGGLGWLVGVMGVLPAGVSSVCKWAFLASLLGLALTQGRDSPSLGGKIGNGLYSVYGITSYVGDLASYTRVAALALSGAYIGISFNMMAGMVLEGFASAGILMMIVKGLFGALIFVAGHVINVGLSLLSAYVHTSRLQYVEFFGKFFEGGGVPFKPLKPVINHVTIQK